MEEQEQFETVNYIDHINKKNLDIYLKKIKDIFKNNSIIEIGNKKINYPLKVLFTCNIPEGKKKFLDNIKNSALYYEIKENCTFRPEYYFNKNPDIFSEELSKSESPEYKHNCILPDENYFINKTDNIPLWIPPLGGTLRSLILLHHFQHYYHLHFYYKFTCKTLKNNVLECYFTKKLIDSDFPKRLFNYLCNKRNVECCLMYLPPISSYK